MPQTNCPLAQGVRMTRGETIFAWAYYPFYLLLTPLLIQLVFALGGWEYDVYTLNLVFFYVNFLAVVIGCRRFLAESLRQTQLLRLVLGVLTGYAVNYAGSLLLAIFSTALPEYSNPADANTTSMILQQGRVMAACAVLLGPLVEEVLVRGLIFGPLSRRSRMLAYTVSTLVFSALHLWEYVGSASLPALLLSLLDYVPASIALAAAYERGGTIWSPIALHMLLNGMSLWALSALGGLG